MIIKLLTEHHLEFLSLKGGCRGLSESIHVKMPRCWKSHALAQILLLFYPQVLTGHHEAITAIQFDKWHIVTGGRDGYGLIWSAQGDHNRCLAALRHPK